MKRIVISGALIFCGVLNASAADTFIFKDVQKPHGRDRSMAVKLADGRKCGWTADGRVLTSERRMEQCMLSRGWMVSQYIPDPLGDYANSVQFTDVTRGGRRGDAELQADSSRCDPQNALDHTSRAFKRCMLSQGWRFYAYTPPTAQSDSDAKADESPSYSPPDTSSSEPPDMTPPPAPYEAPAAPDIHPFCPNPIC